MALSRESPSFLTSLWEEYNRALVNSPLRTKVSESSQLPCVAWAS